MVIINWILFLQGIMVTTDETILTTQDGTQSLSEGGISPQGNISSGGTWQSTQQDDVQVSSSSPSQDMHFDLGMEDVWSSDSPSQESLVVENVAAPSFSLDSSEDSSTVSADDFSLDFDDSVFASPSPEKKELDAVEQEIVDDPAGSTELSPSIDPISLEISDSPAGDSSPSFDESLPLQISSSEPMQSIDESSETPEATPVISWEQNVEVPSFSSETSSSPLDFNLDLGSFSDSEPLSQETIIAPSDSSVSLEPELPVVDSSLPQSSSLVEGTPLTENSSFPQESSSPFLSSEEVPSTLDSGNDWSLLSDENSSSFFTPSESLWENNTSTSEEVVDSSLSTPSFSSWNSDVLSSPEETSLSSFWQLSNDDLLSDTLPPTTFSPLAEEENSPSWVLSSDDSLSSFSWGVEASMPESSYQPTEDAFWQTISALQNAKDEGNSFISSEELPVAEATSQDSENSDSMLNLDQMVAKFHGEEIPEEENPFEPMKKALEEEEKKALLEKGVNPDDGIPLVLSPEATLVSEETPAPVITESPSPENIPAKDPLVQEETPVPVQQEQIPEDKPATDPAMFSLDDIIPEGPIPVPVSQEITTKLPSLKNKNLTALLVGWGIFAVLILVITTMFPDVISSLFTSPPNSSNIDIVTPVDPNEIPNIDGENHGSPSDSQGSGDNSSEDFTGNVLPDPSLDDPQIPLGEVEDDWSGTPFVEEPDETPSIPTSVSSQEMISILTSLSNQGKQYLDLWESENEPFLVKFGWFIWYQAGLLINRLESGGSLSIEEYTNMVTRMNNFLTNMQGYLDGSYDPSVSSQDSQFVDEEFNKQELQDFIYGQNGL